MKAVVIGGSGHIGTYLAPMLANAGYETISVSRGQANPYEWNPGWNKVAKIRLDRSDPRFESEIASLDADIVVDLINFTLDQTRAIAGALKNTKLSHYLYCSSCWAHGRAEILPFNPDDLNKVPVSWHGKNYSAYGDQKFASEMYLKDEFRQNGFPATIIMPGQISGPGWTIMNPWANKFTRPFQIIANGEKIYLPNFGMETLHHVHGEDVARVFFQAIQNRNAALGESFHAVSGGSITLYGYAKLMYDFFGKKPDIGFLPWDKWSEYVGDEAEVEDTYYHITRSGFYDTDKERRLLNYQPRYSNVDTIKIAVQSYVDRGMIKLE